MRGLFVGVLLFAFVVPSAGAQAIVHATITPKDSSVTLAPGASTDLPYEWSVRFENTTCTSPAKVGLDLIVVSSPPWASPNLQPHAVVADYPIDNGSATLELSLDSEGPRPAEGNIPIALQLNLYDPGMQSCAPPPKAQTEWANLTVHVTGPSPTSTTSETTTTRGSPDASAVLLGVAAFGALFVQRRRVA